MGNTVGMEHEILELTNNIKNNLSYINNYLNKSVSSADKDKLNSINKNTKETLEKCNSELEGYKKNIEKIINFNKKINDKYDLSNLVNTSNFDKLDVGDLNKIISKLILYLKEYNNNEEVRKFLNTKIGYNNYIYNLKMLHRKHEGLIDLTTRHEIRISALMNNNNIDKTERENKINILRKEIDDETKKVSNDELEVENLKKIARSNMIIFIKNATNLLYKMNSQTK
jgi:hypothetical protein